MTDKNYGGVISSRIALTMEAQSALDIGDPVSVVGPYECDAADSGATFVGVVTKSNKRRAGNVHNEDVVPGDVTVECPGSMVLTVVAEVDIDAGEVVHLSATAGFVPAGDATAVGQRVGLALTSATATNKLDVLFD